jgi:hypothetical protein
MSESIIIVISDSVEEQECRGKSLAACYSGRAVKRERWHYMVEIRTTQQLIDDGCNCECRCP